MQLPVNKFYFRSWGTHNLKNTTDLPGLLLWPWSPRSPPPSSTQTVSLQVLRREKIERSGREKGNGREREEEMKHCSTHQLNWFKLHHSLLFSSIRLDSCSWCNSSWSSLSFNVRSSFSLPSSRCSSSICPRASFSCVLLAAFSSRIWLWRRSACRSDLNCGGEYNALKHGLLSLQSLSSADLLGFLLCLLSRSSLILHLLSDSVQLLSHHL